MQQPIAFSESAKYDLSDARKYFLQTATDFASISRKYKKWAIFDIFMTITPRANMITRQMTPFFHLLFELYPLVFFISSFEDLQNSVP